MDETSENVNPWSTNYIKNIKAGDNVTERFDKVMLKNSLDLFFGGVEYEDLLELAKKEWPERFI